MRKFSFLLALLCASVMGFAIDWSGYAWIGNGSGNAAYTDKFKMTLAEGQAVVNIQEPGFATAPGIYTTLPAGIISCSLPASAYDVQGAGMILHVAYFTAQETEITVVHGTGTAVFTVYYADGTTGGGGGDPDPDPYPEPAGINWNDYSWIGNGSGNAAYTDKFKMTLATGQAVVNIQQPGFATAPGIYTTFPAGIISCTLPASAYDVQGAGMILHVDAFTAQETEVTVVHGTGTAVFTVYYADGTTGGGGDPAPTKIYDTNFALASQGSSATASSGNASLAIDGDEGTRWESAAADGETWDLDMGQLRIFNTIKILWEGAYCKEFELTYSTDGESWSPLYTETNLTSAGWQLIELSDEVTARYIHYNGTLRATGWGQSFFEFQVLLPGVSVLTSIDLTSPATIAQIGGAGVALTAQPKDQNGQNMEAEVSWEITPAAAGHMSGNTYIPDQIGNASIRAYNGDVYSTAVSIIGVPSANLALSTNITTDNKIIAQSEFAPNGTDAFHAVDGNMGSIWQGSPTAGNVDDSQVYDSWFVVDLGAYYNIALVALHFEGACSELYHIDFSANNVDWNLGYNLVGAGGINARNDYWTDLDNNTKVRYVRFWSTKAATGWGMKMYEFEVYGTTWVSGDEEKPVMGTASLVSSTYDQAVIAVTATDNDEVARYHVVDASNGIDVNCNPAAGNITVTGLTHGTNYNFTITAKDATGNESDNSVVLPVAIPFNTGANLALNQPCEGGYYDNNPAESDDKANDGNTNTQWTTYGAHAIESDWWVVDLGQIYNLTNITILWGDQYATNYILQARVEAPSAADKANDAAWVTLATVADAAASAEKSTNVSGVGRYVRFRALAHTGFMRLKEFRAYASGVAAVDTEAPSMTSASLVSSADTYAVIAVAATDNQGIANFHVVDAGNSFNANFVAEAGNITVTGLAGGTAYNLIITAIDFFGNESANSKSVEVTTTAHYTEPQTAAPVPTWPAEQVKSLYSNTYDFAPASINSYNEGWWAAPVMTEGDVDENTYLHYNLAADGMIGWQYGEISVASMEKLHIDIFSSGSGTLTIRPITTGGPEVNKTLTLVGQQWNSFDIALTEFPGHDWTKLFQFAIEHWNAGGLTGEHISVDNVYFYRESALVDSEAPTNFSASRAEESFFSVKINAQASDNSGAVIFTVKNGDDVVATQNAVSAAATVINVTGLNAGTAYNFNVYVADEAGNTIDPIAVAATTKALPSAAPVPTLAADMVKSIYSETYTTAITGGINFNEGWWQAPTIAQEKSLEGNNARYYGGLNTNGVFGITWSGDHKLDAADYQIVHFHIYPTNSATIEIYPVIQPEGEFHRTSQTLVGGQWNEVVIDYSDKTFAPFNQFGVVYTNVLGDFFIDNLFFEKSPNLVRDDSWMAPGELGTICIPNGAIAKGGDIYELVGKNSEGKIVFATVPNNQMTPGKPYLFEATSNAMKFYYTAEDAVGNPVNTGAMKGTFADITLPDTDLGINDLSDIYYFADHALWSCADISTLSVPANRAYVKLSEVDNIGSSSPAPGRRYITMGVNGKDAATGFDQLNASEAPMKMIIDGQLFILRGEKLYDATGRLVK
ncbi:MAG: discoidin domain-containing protein [Paludibacteraceae bacterium]|nr:discoidin domain-containing protein [Paludibacteraceae bacterium]